MRPSLKQVFLVQKLPCVARVCCAMCALLSGRGRNAKISVQIVLNKKNEQKVY